MNELPFLDVDFLWEYSSPANRAPTIYFPKFRWFLDCQLQAPSFIKLKTKKIVKAKWFSFIWCWTNKYFNKNKISKALKCGNCFLIILNSHFALNNKFKWLIVRYWRPRTSISGYSINGKLVKWDLSDQFTIKRKINFMSDSPICIYLTLNLCNSWSSFLRYLSTRP